MLTQRKKKGPNVWVVRSGSRFSVKEERLAVSLVPPVTQRLAIVIARLLACANGSELVVQSRRGNIRVKDSHGADRFPPRG
ncbi:MAG: hypothetical protein JWM95_699 [Gemmatimonadetes bacterium]|nr:hypothetical protein [Gemmatimonadota bacterium]